MQIKALEKEQNLLGLENEYIVAGLLVIIALAIIGIVYYLRKRERKNGIKEAPEYPFEQKINEYFKSIEDDYYRYYLYNRLSKYFKIQELNKSYKYNVTYINSLLDLGIDDEYLQKGNNYLISWASQLSNKIVDQPSFALRFLTEYFRLEGKRRALKQVEEKYGVRESFPEKFSQIQDSLDDNEKSVFLSI